MKSSDKLFTLNESEKELIKKISSLCGLKQDIINQVWQFTFFTVIINLLEKKDSNFNEVTLPYIGKIIISPDKENINEFRKWPILSQSFEELLKNIKNDNETGLIKFFQENFINKVIDNIVEEE